MKSKWMCLILLGLFALADMTFAGVTIHFEGTLKDKESLRLGMSVALEYAKKRGWGTANVLEKNAEQVRVIGEKEVKYRGPMEGIVIRPDEMCEPIHLEFGNDLFCQDFVKTQFAGPEVHVQIIELFKRLEPHFKTLKIEDEGEYWETADRKRLQQNMDTVDRMIREAKAKNPAVRGPVKLPDGRIVDLIQ